MKPWKVYQRGARFRIGYEYKTLFRRRTKIIWYQYRQGFAGEGGDWIIYETRNRSQACEKLAAVEKEELEIMSRAIEQANYERDQWKGVKC